MKWKTRNIVSLLFLTFFTLIAGLAASISYRIVREIILSNIKQATLLSMEHGVDDVDRWLLTCKTEIATLANTPILKTMDWSNIQPYLQSEAKRLPDFFLFLVAEPDGSYYSTQLGRTRFNVKDRDWFTQAIQGKGIIADPVISHSTGLPQINVSAPIIQIQSPIPVGALSGNIKVDKVVQVVKRLQMGAGSYAFMLNSKGVPIAHPNSALIGTQERPALSFLESANPNLAQIAQQMTHRAKGIALIQMDGMEQYIAYVPLQETNWSIALVIPRSNIESQLDALNLLAMVLGSLLCIAIAGAWRQMQLIEQVRDRAERETQQVKLLNETMEELHQAQLQMIQSEKMSGLGQLVAGVAHEINNPINFIHGNLHHATVYTQNLLALIKLYQTHYPHPDEIIQTELVALDLEFMLQDLPKLLTSMAIGTQRIKEITRSLRVFSQLDEAEVKEVSIHDGIDSTLMILQSRTQPTPERLGIEIIKNYGSIPPVECYAGQVNQVFMNILSNAIDALESMGNGKSVGSTSALIRDTVITAPKIWIATEVKSEMVVIRIKDNGLGIPAEIQSRIFDPFFTTKPIGKGTGMGLAISYQIVTKTHQGRLQCHSAQGQGTEFEIEIPINPPKLPRG